MCSYFLCMIGAFDAFKCVTCICSRPRRKCVICVFFWFRIDLSQVHNKWINRCFNKPDPINCFSKSDLFLSASSRQACDHSNDQSRARIFRNSDLWPSSGLIKYSAIRISFGFSIADNVALGVLYGPWVVPMKSWFVQLSIGVTFVLIGGVVQSLEAPKHPIVTSLGHVRDPNCRNSDLSNSPHSSQ